MKAKRFLALLLSVIMVLGMMPMTVFAYYDGDSLEVCTEGKTYSLFTEDNLEGQNGTTFLYVVKSGDRYYTLGNPRYTTYKEVDSVYAVDITEYYDAQNNTFSGIPDSANVGAMQYQMNSGSYMYVDGDMLFALSIPFESEGNTWFEGGIRYYEPDQTYSYDRPSWHSNGDGTGYFYDSYKDWFGDSDEWVYGVLDLKYTGTSYVFALRDKSAEYTEAKNAEPDNYNISVGSYAYLYAAPCGHEQNVHGDAYTPTCMEKGCHEYWYCHLCGTYFSDKNMTVAFDDFPEIDALGHDFDNEKCKNCNRPVPVYSKVTNKTDFLALADDTMYVLVAEYEGKYYTPDSSTLYSYVFDLDGDGYADIYNVDENNNGTPDVAEFDYDENGVYDLWDYQTEEERLEYFDSICHGYLTDMLYGQTVGIPVKEITLNPDGTISHDAVKDALEFEMIKLHSQEEINDSEEVFRYTYECVMQFVIPNTFINSPAFIPEDRPFGKEYPDEGDTYYWAVLFYNDRDSYYTYDWENDTYVGGLPFLDVCKDGSIALSKSWNAFSPEFGEQLGCLRLRDYNGKLSFVVGNDYDLEGSEWVDDENGGYYDTHDTQACVYLYASAQYDSHTCDFGDWVDDGNGRTHTHTCKDSECGKTETKPHNWDNGVETGAPTCTESGTTTYTCPDCKATKTEPIPALDHDFGDWTYDSVDSHIRHCKRENCNAEDFGGHEWGNWVSVDENIHKMTCSVCNGYQTDDHEFDNGVVTKEPTEWETGIKTYTCTDCKHTKTETIDKLVHECVWTDWYPNGDENHKRDCMDDNCDKFETLPHEWDSGEITKEPTCKEKGVKTYTCQTCMHTRTEDVPTTDHEFGDWTPNNDGKTHSHFCSCNESETADHKFDDGEVTQAPTHEAAGEKKYTCSDCGYFYTEEIPALTEHEWSDWAKKDDKSHIRECKCGVTETKDHIFDAGTVTKEPTHIETGVKTFTCVDCGFVREDTLDKTPEHSFGEWKPEATVVGKHYRECACGKIENADCTYDEGVVTVEPTYEATGTKTYTCTACGGTKTETLDILVKAEEIVSPDNSDVKITAPEGSNAVLNENTVLKVEEVTDEISEDVKANIEVVFEDNNAEVLASYDISLLLDGVTVQPGGTVEVTLPAPENAGEYGNLQVVYIDDDGNVTPCETRMNDDGTITFVTDHFSHYAIIGVPGTSPVVWILISAISVALIAGAVVAVVIIKKKKGIA